MNLNKLTLVQEITLTFNNSIQNQAILIIFVAHNPGKFRTKIL